MKIKITNKLGLPRAYVLAVQNDPYSSSANGQHSDYTITGLLKAPRAAVLASTTELEVDAADMLAVFEGQLIHAMLERAKPQLEAEGFIVEERFFKTYEVDGKKFIVSAQIDVYDPKEARVSDYKYTSVASAQYGLKDDHRKQVNFQAMLLREKGHLTNILETVMLMKDWSPMRVHGNYPTSPTMLHNIAPTMSDEEVNNFIIERIRLHEAAKLNLPLCTPEERFSRPTFAVMKSTTAKRAERVFDTHEEAAAYIAAKDPSLLLVSRPGVSINCAHYCQARFVCEQRALELPPSTVDEDGFTKV